MHEIASNIHLEFPANFYPDIIFRQHMAAHSAGMQSGRTNRHRTAAAHSRHCSPRPWQRPARRERHWPPQPPCRTPPRGATATRTPHACGVAPALSQYLSQGNRYPEYPDDPRQEKTVCVQIFRNFVPVGSAASAAAHACSAWSSACEGNTGETRVRSQRNKRPPRRIQMVNNRSNSHCRCLPRPAPSIRAWLLGILVLDSCQVPRHRGAHQEAVEISSLDIPSSLRTYRMPGYGQPQRADSPNAQ